MFVDTSFCIDLMREHARGERGPAIELLCELDTEPLRMSLYVFCELRLGASLAKVPQRELTKCDALTEYIELVGPDEGFTDAYVRCELALRKQGKPAPTMDVLIAATAFQHNEALITRDAQHFHFIDGLVLRVY